MYVLTGNPDNPDGTSIDHEYFLIHDDLFDRILATDRNSYILLNLIKKDVLLPSINYNGPNSKSRLRNGYEMV